MNQYTLQSKLGEGAFSTVYKVNRKQDGQDYAMKKMRIMGFSEKQLANCLNQVRILASIEDSHVVAYKDSFFDELTKTFCIVTEYLDGGDVAHVIAKHKSNKKSVDEKFIWKVAHQVLKGLAALHKQKILHRDVKSANIFMTKCQKLIKLGDMNVSIVSSNGMAKTQTGTPYYASPEVWNQKPYSTKCDIWSLGCVLYELASLRPPFVSADMKGLKRLIISGVYKRIPLQYSDQLENFIRMCLKVDPTARLSAQQLLKQTHFESANQFGRNSDLKSQFRLLEKINVPRKRDFRVIKDKLPRNRFSVDKVLTNSSYMDEKDKQNIQSMSNSIKISDGCTKLIAIKKQTLPAIQRPSSASGPQSKQTTQTIKSRPNNQVQVIEPQEKPPLPRNRALRA